MLYTYTLSEQTVTPNGAIVLDQNGIDSCCAISHVAGSTTINLRQGTYLISVDCDATSDTTGPLSFQLYNHDVAVPAALATNTIATAGNIANFNFDAAIKVLCSCPAINNNAQLTIKNTGANPATISNVVVTVHRL